MGRKKLSIFLLVMMNLAALGTVKNWPTTAIYGFSSLSFLLLAALIFLIPVALVSAELGTGWPRIGGVFIWVQEAFGHRLGFLAIWLLWIENIIWYPTILAFIAGAFAYLINPNLIENKALYLIVMIGTFWAVTLLNFRGIKTSGWVSSIGVIFGTFIPAIIIISLGLSWFFMGNPIQFTISLKSLVPNLSSLNELVFFTGVILSLAGLEMNGIHIKDMEYPKREYPKALLISVLLITGLSMLGILSIAAVIPSQQMSLTAGALQALSIFLGFYHLSSWTPILAGLIILGAISSLSTWLIGPSRGLLAASQKTDLPQLFQKTNHNDVPVPLLVIQAIIVTLLSLLFIYMPTLNAAYWLITALVAQVYLIMYLLMFAAAIRLRYTQPHRSRSYKIPFGNIGMWVVASVGSLASIGCLIIGFLPPAQITTGNELFYVGFLLTGIVLICLGPTLIKQFQKWSS